MNFNFFTITQLDTQNTIGIGKFLLCILFSLIGGLIFALTNSIKNKCSKTFKASLIILPVIVCVVILMVNGQIGVGVAVAGAFSLVKFRSAPGSAKEICSLFASMCIGLIAGSGYLEYAVIFSLVISLIMITINFIFNIISQKNDNLILKITIPEDLEYEDVFSEIFNEYTKSYELTNVKTTNMGSMFKLTYNIILNKDRSQKEFIDKLRIRNGNLEINIHRAELNDNEL